LCAPLFRACLAPVDRVLADAKMAKSDIRDVVLIGGSTRIPKIQSMLASYFGKSEDFLCKSINPDEAVAYGAAVQGAILAGVRDKALEDILLVDVTPLSLGLETAGGVMTVLIPRNTPIPTKASETFTTHSPNQTSVTLSVYQGERAMVKDNNELGSFSLSGIAPAARGKPRIDVTFEVDANGIVGVTALDQDSQVSQGITISSDRGALSDADLERMIKEAEEFAAADAAARERVSTRNAVESYAFTIKDQLSTAASSPSPPVDPTLLNAALVATNDTLAWIDANPSASVDELHAKSSSLQSEVQPVLSELGASVTPPPQ